MLPPMSGKSNQIIGRVLATLFFATVVGFWVYVTSVPMASELELALQSAPTMPSDAPCTETYDPAIGRSERSKLFEPAS